PAWSCASSISSSSPERQLTAGTLSRPPVLPLRFEHDDRALFERHRSRESRPPQDGGNGFERLALRLAHAVAVDGVAHVELELRDRIRPLERNQRAAVSNRHELHA